MPLLYRSPNVLVDGCVWHVRVTVQQRNGKRVVQYLWRRYRNDPWRAAREWPAGRLPKGLKDLVACKGQIRSALVSPDPAFLPVRSC
ncbi:MAG: hypothetical protein GEV06_16680 [Luteitalea sp.]|nr:hypothetical protein [Luteitalea sp.]